LYRRLGGPQSRSGSYREEKNLCLCWESNPGRPARSPGTKDRKNIKAPENKETRRIFVPMTKEVASNRNEYWKFSWR
jgi:hypothetical protein